MEVCTGRALDVEITAKCISGACKDRDKYKSPCPQGRFHGSSSDMERHNAIKLFKRSKGIGFRYTNYVMDVVIVTKKMNTLEIHTGENPYQCS